MLKAPIRQRRSKYCDAIEQALRSTGHATNSELLHFLSAAFPDVSATTIHRATTRLAERGAIAVAPRTREGSMRYDSNIAPHDHFMCNKCDTIRDANVVDKVTPILESSIGSCRISGRLTINGVCNNCEGK